MLEIEDFRNLIKNAPLISIDFIIENNEEKILLGKRINKPAKDYWFTPGGRILKNESIDNAIKRLLKKEINLEITKEKIIFYGVYEHFYEDSFVHDKISTHYVVLVYEIKLNGKLKLPLVEHNEYNFFSKKELNNNKFVHENVKEYFKKGI